MIAPPPETSGRRPLASRNVPVFRRLAAWLARNGASPNAISAASIAFGCAAGTAFALTAASDGLMQRGWWLAAAICIQLRLLANMLDGMVAVEGRLGGPTGDIWNEAPDRVSDIAILLGAGYAAGSDPILGWAAALSAVMVAYVRALGASTGAGQVFAGPMAKPQRMFWMTLVSLFFALVPEQFRNSHSALGGIVMTVCLAGAFVDVKTGLAARSVKQLVQVAAVLVVALVLRDWITMRWLAPIMPTVLFAITVGGIYTAVIRTRVIAAKLRAQAAAKVI